MKSLKAADIEIGGRVTTMRPWTVQHQGCGEKGVTVRISEEFFYNNNDNFDSKLKGGGGDYRGFPVPMAKHGGAREG